ncbi:MAG TPA: DUF881 domain-containing protein [Acidimicrobiales bacterium]|nr:DUF881 domain-containing protein [Acidimicrobiales bacterium]
MTAPIAARRGVAGGPILVVVVTALVGFLLVSQFRNDERLSQRLEAESEEDLARILANLNTEADALRDEIGTLRVQLADLEASSRNDAAAATAGQEQLHALQVLAGTVPVTGPGVVVDVADPRGSITYDTFIDLVQELRDAGAEAVSVNGQRIGVASAFAEGRGGGVTLNGVQFEAPFKVFAIGQPPTLEGGLKIPGGALDTLSALAGVTAQVQRSPKVDIPALAAAPTLRAARPVGSGS